MCAVAVTSAPFWRSCDPVESGAAWCGIVLVPVISGDWVGAHATINKLMGAHATISELVRRILDQRGCCQQGALC